MTYFKTVSFFFLLLFFSINIQAQDVTVHYNQTIDLDEPQITKYELYIAQNQSLYFDVTGKKSTKITEKQEDNLNTFNIIEEHKPENIYVDFTDKTLKQSTYLGEENYVIKENLYPFNWNITNETKQIANYTCTKATTKFRGRNYEAWFTEEIPTSAGPWKMNSLPGLILELYDTDHLIVVQAKKVITQSLGKEQTDLISDIKNTETKTYKEYDKLFKEHVQELFNKMATKMPEGFSGSMKIDENCEDCKSLEIYEEWEN